MKAAIFERAGQPLAVDDVPMPEPGEGEVLIRIERCGICGSDLKMTDAGGGLPSGSRLGHEVAGQIVARAKGAERFGNGDRIAMLPIRSCGGCAACLAGLPAQCSAMCLHGGGFAEFVAVHERQCIPLPATLSAEDGALVEPLAVARHGVDLADLQPGARVLVIGAGPIGLAVAYWARRLGASRVAMLASSRRRAVIAQAMEVDAFVTGGDAADAEETAARIAAELGGQPDIVFECVGKPGQIARAISLVRPRGTVVVLGLCDGLDSFAPMPAILKEVRIQMSVFYGVRDFEDSARALDAGHVSPRNMVTRKVGLEEFPLALEALRAGADQCKIMVSPGE